MGVYLHSRYRMGGIGVYGKIGNIGIAVIFHAVGEIIASIRVNSYATGNTLIGDFCAISIAGVIGQVAVVGVGIAGQRFQVLVSCLRLVRIFKILKGKDRVLDEREQSFRRYIIGVRIIRIRSFGSPIRKRHVIVIQVV